MSKPGCCCKSANEPSPNCAYCGNKKQANYNNQNQYGYGEYQGYDQKSNYSYGKGQPVPTDSQYSGARYNNNLPQSSSGWALLRPVLVFGAGCYLTSKMVTVASELG